MDQPKKTGTQQVLDLLMNQNRCIVELQALVRTHQAALASLALHQGLDPQAFVANLQKAARASVQTALEKAEDLSPGLAAELDWRTLEEMTGGSGQ